MAGWAPQWIKSGLLCAGVFGAALGLGTAPIQAQSNIIDSARAGQCGSVDLVIAIDTTHSMARAIREMKRESVRLLDLIALVSNGDFRLGLISFRDEVTVEMDLGSVQEPEKARTEMSWTIRRLDAEGGRGGPEASDEALRTAILSLSSDGREQTGEFAGAWEAKSRILVLITDNLPGGFDDTFIEGEDDANARLAATEALQRDIRISSIYVPTSQNFISNDGRIAEIMRTYPLLTGGVFAATAEFGSGTAEAIADIIARCGSRPLS